MNRLFGMFRYNKQLLIIFIVAIIEICFVVSVGVFDVIQIVILNRNAAKLSPVFVPLNIALAISVGICLVLIITMFVIKVVKGKKNEFKEN